ncbi:DUF6171 family protein [Treponema sp. OttesenSCG-928-L16]|nr:DUF6171 family protein [Treponema sp. OttesenSCG-928-L16]
MDASNTCEACSVSVWLSEEEIKQLFGETMRVKNIKTVTEKEYEERMTFCRSCEALVYGSTCRHCGCIVHIKAKLQSAKCPYPFEPKW